MKMREWENLVRYASRRCEEATKRYGMDFRYSIYRMYDGSRGISIELFDSFGMLYDHINTGIFDFETMKRNVDKNIRRLVADN